MRSHRLTSPRQADDAIARFFLEEQTARIEVIEQQAFTAEAPLSLGTIRLATLDSSPAQLRASVRLGSFEWQVPTVDEVATKLRELLSFEKYDSKKRSSAEERLTRLLDDMAGIAVRLGLVSPRFDAHSVANMPFRRPTTVVADTSGVHQGALSFVAQHLHPMARMKVPAVLHMEVINQADRYLKSRRSGIARAEVILAEHLLSQTGQRVLMRLELRDDAEVERNLMVGDPLRSAFREDRDPDLRDLNLNIPLKSYVDRMILESARQHQAYSSPGHPVHLLTGDQGLARMALAEGISPLFFKKVDAAHFFSLKLTGTNFSPFSGRITSTPISSVLWELATAFGSARLKRDGSDQAIEIVAIDKDLGWSSFHSKDDLLWFRANAIPDWPEKIENTPASLGIHDGSAEKLSREAPAKHRARSRPRQGTSVATRLSETNGAGVPFYRLNSKGLVSLIDLLATGQKVDDSAVSGAVGLQHPTGLAEYRRFLLSAKLIADSNSEWAPTERLLLLGTAQRERDLAKIAEILATAPSFSRFLELLKAAGQTNEPVALPIPPRVLPSYLALGEVTGVGAHIPGEGYYATLATPPLSEFVPLALARFEALSTDSNWASVGEWLEALIRSDAIHPTFARDSLQEAAAGNLIGRWTEGSTTDTRHDDHTLRVLSTHTGLPRVETVFLYRGDFLMPEKSSSSLRLEAIKP